MADRMARIFVQRFVGRVLHKASYGLAMLVSLAWVVCTTPPPRETARADIPAATASFEWPAEWDGAVLRPLALSAVEERFARQFPGRMARLTDGRQVLVLRQVDAPTRMLHPATDCYRALGYRITDARLETDRQQRRWRCFLATRTDGTALRVCERIVDSTGHTFTDSSAWYWAAASGRSHGPWQAVTTAAHALPGGSEPGVGP